MIHLLWVLLGLLGPCHTKDTIHQQRKQFMGNVPLVVSGDFLPPVPLDPHTELQAARWAAKIFVPAPITWNNRSQNTYILPGLQDSTHVLVRQDHVRPSLSPPYQVPFQVIQHGNRATMTEVNGKRDCVSSDRLKPAYTTPMIFDVYMSYGQQSRQPSRLGM